MWARVLQMLLGVALMAAPDVLSYSGPSATSDRIVGPLIVTFAAIAVGESTRPVRWWVAPLGVWLVIAAWALSPPSSAFVLELVAGFLAVLLSLVRGPIHERMGGGWRALMH